MNLKEALNGYKLVFGRDLSKIPAFVQLSVVINVFENEIIEDDLVRPFYNRLTIFKKVSLLSFIMGLVNETVSWGSSDDGGPFTRWNRDQDPQDLMANFRGWKTDLSKYDRSLSEMEMDPQEEINLFRFCCRVLTDVKQFLKELEDDQ